MPNWTSKGR